jgi:transcriptional regulator with XRE-family HTH domain
MINGSQIRAARALLNWTQQDLVGQTRLSFTTIKRMESIGTGRSSADNVQAVQNALEAAGIVFIAENGGGAGVRLSRPGGEK